jgi:Bacterial Ig-like domain (group 3)
VKRKATRNGKTLLLALLAAPFLIGFGTGCGDFWQAPIGGGTTADTVSLTASVTTATVGTSVTFTATVSPATATGSVKFYNGTTLLGTTTLTSGVATLPFAFTTAGTPSVTANYSGDSTYEESTSTAVSLTVTAVGTTSSATTLTASPSAPTTGTSVTLTATVAPSSGTGTPTGTVTFYDTTTTTSLGTGTLSSGATTVSATFSVAETHALTATYSGDGTYAGSTGNLNLSVGSTTSASDCGYQDSTNNVFSTAFEAYASGSNTLTNPAINLSATLGDESAICAENVGTSSAAATSLTATDPVILSSSAGSNQTDSSFYGTNAAVLAYGQASGTVAGGTINLTGGSINSAGAYGNGVFASGFGATVNLTGTSITTSGANAHAAVATEGGTLNLTNVSNATTFGQGSAVIATDQGGGTVTITNGAFTADDAEAVVVEGAGSVTVSGTSGGYLSGTLGDYRGILLYQDTATTDPTVTTNFAMTNGTIVYTCQVSTSSTDPCAGTPSTGQSNPATVFAIANTKATISLTDVTVTNSTSTTTDSQGTLLTAAALNSGTWGAAGSNGGNVTFTAQGETLTGDVIVDQYSSAALSILKDGSGTGSTLAGAINAANSGSTSVTLTLDAASVWTVTGTSYLTTLAGLEVSSTTVSNIDGGGHCVYYSGNINGASSTTTYTLSGGSGGYLAPAGTTGLTCN